MSEPLRPIDYNGHVPDLPNVPAYVSNRSPDFQLGYYCGVLDIVTNMLRANSRKIADLLAGVPDGS